MSKMYQISVFSNRMDFTTEDMDWDEMEMALEVLVEKFPKEEGFSIQVWAIDRRISKLKLEDVLK